MWAIGELKLPHQRIDVGGAFGKNNEPPYLAMNPNGARSDAGGGRRFTLWESNSIVRYLAAKIHDRTLEPADLKTRALAQKWMDWQLSGHGPGDHAGVLGPDPHAAGEARRHRHRGRQGQDHRGRARCSMSSSAKTQYLAGDAFSYGDIPVGIMTYRYVQLIPERPSTANLDRWYAAISSRPAFKEQVASVPLT